MVRWGLEFLKTPEDEKKCGKTCPKCRPRYDTKIREEKVDDDLRHTVKILTFDTAAEEFKQSSIDMFEGSLPPAHYLAYTISYPVLSWFGYSNTDMNGIFGTGRMHLLSTSQLRILLEEQIRKDNQMPTTLLDVGAGDGNVTCQFKPLFDRIVATEVSANMIAALQAHGFETVQTYNLTAETRLQELNPDVVSCLNVFDRCSKPISLIQDMRKLMRLGALLIVSIVLPFKPYVESGMDQLKPEELIELPRISFEADVCYFCKNFMDGFDVVSMSRVPYLSEGNPDHPLYTLDTAILVFRAVEYVQA